MASGEAQPQVVHLTSDELGGDFPELDHEHACGLLATFTAEGRNCVHTRRWLRSFCSWPAARNRTLRSSGAVFAPEATKPTLGKACANLSPSLLRRL